MEFLKKIFITIAMVTAVACGYDRFDNPPGVGESYYPIPNTGIGDVRALCGEGIYNVNADIVIGGYITANDKSGNVYRSFFIEDDTGAAEIRAGMYNLHNVFVLGRYVAIKLDGLSVSLYNGVLQVGLSPSEGYSSVDYFDSWVFASEYIYPVDEYSGPTPSLISPAGLSEDMCGRLVRLERMKFYEDLPEEVASGETAGLRVDDLMPYDAPEWAYPRSEDNPVPRSEYRYFKDAGDNRIAVYTSGYASFAGRKIPLETVSVTGILSYGSTGKGKMFILRLRDHDDVVLQVAF